MILSLVLLGGLAFLYRKVIRLWLPFYFKREDVQDDEQRRTRRLVQLCFLLLAIIIFMLSTGLDYRLYLSSSINMDGETGSAELENAARRGIWISTVLFALLLFLIARLLDWVISHILTRNFLKRREAVQKIAINFDQPRLVRPARRLLQPVIYVLTLLFLAYVFNLDITLKETFSIGSGEDARTVSIAITNIISAVLILLVARLINWIFTELVFFPYYQRKEINIGSQYAINQLFKYFLYVFAILIALQSMNINLTILLGGAAALLVGIGLGLQQTFNDLISGIILLSERSVEVGDVLDIKGMVGTVRRIGLRTSLVETRDNMTIIVPNSKLIGDMVTNWSHDEDKARFKVTVGVAYGSDTALVKKLLLQVAQEHPKAMKRPAPFVRFVNFGDSSLDFELQFWTKEFIRIEDVKSDMRFEIDRLFRENKVTIPFPQRDVWMRGGANE
ncbi:MAG: mechanosensitive ion channel [Saprospiraceae bacterium]